MTDWIVQTVESGGYLGIGGLMVLENVFPPIPSEVIMPLAGFATVDGDLSFLGVALAGMVGSVGGALPLYYLGHAFGPQRLRGWVDRHPWLGISGDDLDRARDWFDRHGRTAVLVGRLVPGVRSLISIPAGMAEMPLPRFLLYTALGTAAWSTLLAYLGRLLGTNYGRIADVVGPVGPVVLAVLALACVVWVVRRRRQG